jgi:hypothetical protein
MSAAILRVALALGVCAALIDLLVWHQSIMEMANGHSFAFKALYAIWFVLGSGVATGALMGLAISWIRSRSSGPQSAAAAFIVALCLTSTVCLVLHRGLTDMKFMQDAMSGSRPYEEDSHGATEMNMQSGMDMEMHAGETQPPRFSVVGALTPNFSAVALAVLYAFRRKRRGSID